MQGRQQRFSGTKSGLLRTAHQELLVVRVLVQPLFDHLLAHESDATSPARRCVVQDVVNVEPALVGLGQLVELLLQQDVLKVDVGVDEIDFLGGVLGVVQDVRDDLVHGCDAGSACEHAEF